MWGELGGTAYFPLPLPSLPPSSSPHSVLPPSPDWPQCYAAQTHSHVLGEQEAINTQAEATRETICCCRQDWQVQTHRPSVSRYLLWPPSASPVSQQVLPSVTPGRWQKEKRDERLDLHAIVASFGNSPQKRNFCSLWHVLLFVCRRKRGGQSFSKGVDFPTPRPVCSPPLLYLSVQQSSPLQQLLSRCC